MISPVLSDPEVPVGSLNSEEDVNAPDVSITCGRLESSHLALLARICVCVTGC